MTGNRGCLKIRKKIIACYYSQINSVSVTECVGKAFVENKPFALMLMRCLRNSMCVSTCILSYRHSNKVVIESSGKGIFIGK